MTKLRQPDLFLQHTSPLFKNFPAEGRDDSPVSVIAHSAVISHPSSACTSMEHHTYRDAKLHQLCPEHGYSTSDDDAISNNLALSQESHKVGALESLPETHSFPSRALHGKMGWLLEEPHQKVELSLPMTSDSKDLSSETDSTASEPDASDESSGENFSVFYKGGEASINFSPCKDVTGVHEKTMVIRPSFSWGGRHLMHEDGAEHDGLSAECKHSKWRHDQTSSYGQSESLAISKPLSVSTEFHKSDWHQLKSTDPSGSIKSFLEEREEDPWKQNGLRGTDSCVAKTASSSELTPMGGSFQAVQNGAGSQINQGVLDAWRVSCGAAGKTGSVRALPSYICDAGGRKCVSRTLPSKWEDAEKWLVSVDSPSHSHLRNGVAPSKALHYGIPPTPPVKRNTNMAVPAAKPANYSFSSDEIAKVNLNYSQSAGEAASDSELPKALEYRALVRSNSQKYWRQHNFGESSPKTEAARAETVSKLRCYGEGGNGRKEALPTMINDSRSTGTEPSISDESKEKRGSLRACNVHGVQALGGAIGKNTLSFSNNDGVGERVLVLQPGTLTEILTQDKYADTVVKTPRQEYIVQSSHRARSASMKDASTEISPAVSRRDMGTQITPQPSSRTSKCPTPIKNNSPARHNTPSRQSASWNNTGGLNLLELESCHLAKLELRDLPGDSAFQSFDRSVSIWSTREEEEEESSACLRPPEVLENKLNLLDARASAWEDAERAKFTAKYKREEARIDAWENLERAKAEAEIRKLEVKLEKLRTQATEKIMNKLTVAQRRAHEMRTASVAQQNEQLARIAERATNIRKSGHFPANIGVCFARMA